MLSKMKENIAATIGVNFELIAIDNSIAQQGICKVYNEAVGKATYDIVCFIHEDVIIHSNNWGQHLVKLFEDVSIGLAGVSGTVYKSAYPAVWSACDQSLYRINTIQHFEGQPLPVKAVVNPLQQSFDEVAVIDGVFMATKKDVATAFPFDESMLKGFHCYDLDFSFSIGTKYKIVVSYAILLEHFSEGHLNKNWLNDSLKLHKKWEAILPKLTGEMSEVLKRKSDYLACRSFLQQALDFSGSKKLILQYYLRLIFLYWKFNQLAFTKTVFKNLLKPDN